jgi:hypothetical protein
MGLAHAHVLQMQSDGIRHFLEVIDLIISKVRPRFVVDNAIRAQNVSRCAEQRHLCVEAHARPLSGTRSVLEAIPQGEILDNIACSIGGHIAGIAVFPSPAREQADGVGHTPQIQRPCSKVDTISGLWRFLVAILSPSSRHIMLGFAVNYGHKAANGIEAEDTELGECVEGNVLC